MKSLRDRVGDSGSRDEFVNSSPEGTTPEESYTKQYPARLKPSIDKRVRDYMQHHSRGGESINSLINEGLALVMDKREAAVAEIERLLNKGKKVEQHNSKGQP